MRGSGEGGNVKRNSHERNSLFPVQHLGKLAPSLGKSREVTRQEVGAVSGKPEPEPGMPMPVSSPSCYFSISPQSCG